MKITPEQREKLVKGREAGLSWKDAMDWAGIESRSTANRIWQQHVAEHPVAPKPPQREEAVPVHRRDRPGLADVRAADEPQQFDPVTSAKMSQHQFQQTLSQLARQYGAGAVQAAMDDEEQRGELSGAIQEGMMHGAPRGVPEVRRIDPREIGPDRELMANTGRRFSSVPKMGENLDQRANALAAQRKAEREHDRRREVESRAQQDPRTWRVGR